MTWQRVDNIFNEGSRRCFLGFQFPSRGDRLRVNCNALVSRPDDEDEWRLL